MIKWNTNKKNKMGTGGILTYKYCEILYSCTFYCVRTHIQTLKISRQILD